MFASHHWPTWGTDAIVDYLKAALCVPTSAGRTIAKVARRRRVRYVVMDDSAPTGMRRVTEGAVTATVTAPGRTPQRPTIGPMLKVRSPSFVIRPRASYAMGRSSSAEGAWGSVS